MKNKIFIPILAAFFTPVAAGDSLEQLGFTEDDNVVVSYSPTGAHSETDIPQNRGFFNISYTAVNGQNFLGRTSNFDGGDGFNGARNCLDGSTERFIDHELVMGTHDLLDGIRVWVEDSDATQNLAVILYRQCLTAFGAGDGVFSDVFFNEEVPTSVGEDSMFFNTNYTFQGLTNECKIMVRARFGSPTTCNGVEDISLYKVRAQLVTDELIFKNSFSEF